MGYLHDFFAYFAAYSVAYCLVCFSKILMDYLLYYPAYFSKVLMDYLLYY